MMCTSITCLILNTFSPQVITATGDLLESAQHARGVIEFVHSTRFESITRRSLVTLCVYIGVTVLCRCPTCARSLVRLDPFDRVRSCCSTQCCRDFCAKSSALSRVAN